MLLKLKYDHSGYSKIKDMKKWLEECCQYKGHILFCFLYYYTKLTFKKKTGKIFF